MKKFSLLLPGLLFLTMLNAQDVPRGMKYQAVARNPQGEILADKDIALKVTLFSGNLKNPAIHYSETHNVKTNQLGLFSLDIGSGNELTSGKETSVKKAQTDISEKEVSNFDKIPWSTQEIWMDVAVKDNGSGFITISSSKLLTVPYAFHSRTAGKIEPSDPAPVREDREWKWDNKCECHGGIRSIKLLYLGQSNVKIKAFEKDDLRPQDLVDSFVNVQNGDIIKIDAFPRPDKALKNKTWMQILDGSNNQISLINMPTDCDTRAIGENFGNFSVLEHIDKKDSSVCSICDVRMEWKLDGNAVFDMCNWLGTKSRNDLRIITNNIERIKLTADEQMIIHDSLIVDQQKPTLLSGKLTVDLETRLNQALKVYGPTDLMSRLDVNNAMPTTLTGSLLVKGITDLDNALNVNNLSPTVLTGTLRTDKDALFQGKVLLNNFNHQSFSPTNGALVVNGGFGLGGNLNVGGDSKFGGATEFAGAVSITSAVQSTNTTSGALKVTGGVGIGNQLNVGGATKLGSTLNVTGASTLNSSLLVSGISTFSSAVNANGQVTVNYTGGNNSESDYGAYPLRVQGSSQGIAIKIKDGASRNTNNFVSFWNNGGTIVGRIEGENITDLLNNEDYKNNIKLFDVAIVTANLDVAIASVELIQAALEVGASLASSTPCAGFGVCVTAPILSFIFSTGVNLALKVANEVAVILNLQNAENAKNFYVTSKANQIGVTYQSGAGDYAEWLPKLNHKEKFLPGYIVAIKDGKISLNTENANQVLVISHKPIVLGNMPQKEDESKFEKVAFMGQVPVHVFGKVNLGDYILAGGANNGFGVAVHPSKMKIGDYKKIVGIAWSASTNDVYNKINVAVGLNANDFSNVLIEQDDKINKQALDIKALKEEMEKLIEIVTRLIPGSSTPVIADMGFRKHEEIVPVKPHGLLPNNMHVDNIVYYDVTKEQITAMWQMAETSYVDGGGDVQSHPFWKRFKNDPAFKEVVLLKFEQKLYKAIHTHKAAIKSSSK